LARQGIIIILIGQDTYLRVFSLVSNDEASDDTWNQIGQDIIGEANGDEFGYSVSISEDGETIAVGTFNSASYIRIYLLEDDGTSWGQIGEDIVGEADYDYFGYSVSLSADGSTLAIGAPNNDDNGDDSGQVMVYRINSEESSWERLVQKSILGDNAGDRFGTSVNLSPDGNTLAIGSPGYWEEEDRPGYVRVFSLESSLNTDSWNQIGQDITGEANGDEFGFSVSLSGDGKTLAVGARRADFHSGHVKVYQMDDSVSGWMQLGDDIDGEAAYDNSGWSVSLSADGNTVAISSPINNDNGDASGHVRVFVLE
jgi:6-phosphogluconolactonase (cycloisomerase 2 family)